MVWSVVLAAPPSWAASELGKLTCVRILVEELNAAATSEGITENALEDTLLVGVKTKLPRLRVEPSCSNLLYLNVMFGSTRTVGGGEATNRYGGTVLLEVHRKAVILDTADTALVIVWQKGRLRAGSLPARAKILSAVDELITSFAAEYYKAGNP